MYSRRIKKADASDVTKIVFPVVGFGILYWVLDSFTDDFLFHNVDFVTSLIAPDPMCLWMRLMNIFIISMFAAYAQHLHIKQQRGEQELRQYRDHLEQLVEERTSNLTRTNEQLQHEVAERKKAESFIQNILEAVDEGFVIIDPEYRIISANNAYLNMVKMPLKDILGRHCYEISHRVYMPCHERGEKCPVRQTFVTGLSDASVHIHRNGQGNMVYVETKSYPMRDPSDNIIAVIEIINNITEKTKLEDQLRQSQKMEAVGQLAAGVAHDFSNVLTAIMGYGSLLLSKIKGDRSLRFDIDQMLSSAERGANLIQSLLTFSRKQVISPAPVNANEIIIGIEKLLRRLIGENIELRTNLSIKDLIVTADAGQIEQVLMNLATNARDAMPDGGLLTISTDLVEFHDKFIRTYCYGECRMFVQISVTDAGIGMDETTQEHIFEPFFTTKEAGKGTGLGLAVAYGIIRKHNGHINVYSEPGHGTTFKIYLPLTEGKAKDERTEEYVMPPAGNETVLLVEDDEFVRDATMAALEEFGYKVIAAVDGEEAVKVFGYNKDKVKLIISDIIMPKRSGREVYEEARKIRPDIKVLFISGYSDDIFTRKGIIEEGMNFISKPLNPDNLLKKIREVLDS